MVQLYRQFSDISTPIPSPVPAYLVSGTRTKSQWNHWAAALAFSNGHDHIVEGLLSENYSWVVNLGVKSLSEPVSADQKATDLNIFSLLLNDDVVTDIRFASEAVHGPSPRLFGQIDHLERAAEHARNGVEVASILVVLEPLQADLWDDERYARWTARVGASEAVVAVRMDQRSRSFGPDEVEARAAELGFPSAGASGNDVGDEGYRTAIFDAVA
jgi:hypothetical protein